MKQTGQHIIGFLAGISVILLIPWWQYHLSIKEFRGFGDELFHSALPRIAVSLPVFLIGIIKGAFQC